MQRRSSHKAPPRRRRLSAEASVSPGAERTPLGGRPATSSREVQTRENALVLSRTLLEKSVASLLSSCWMALKRSFFSPLRATPESVASRISPSTRRRCASESEAHAGPFLMARNAS